MRRKHILFSGHIFRAIFKINYSKLITLVIYVFVYVPDLTDTLF